VRARAKIFPIKIPFSRTRADEALLVPAWPGCWADWGTPRPSHRVSSRQSACSSYLARKNTPCLRYYFNITFWRPAGICRGGYQRGCVIGEALYEAKGAPPPGGCPALPLRAGVRCRGV